MQRHWTASSTVSTDSIKPFARRSWSLLAAAAALAAPLLVGCDNSTGKADRAILDGARSAVPAHSVEEATKNVADLDKLTKDENASTPRKALAKAALAGAELELGQQITADLQVQEAQISRKIWEMEQVAGQIQKTKVLIDAAAARNPAEPMQKEMMGEKVVIDDLKNKAAAAREGDAWIKADAASLATVSAVKQSISTLTGKISEINSNVETLTKQREQAMADSSKSQAASEAAKGDESQKLFIAGSESRKQAALLGIQIEAAQASLVPLTQDLAAAQEHEKIVTAAADSFDASAKIYTDEYAKVKEQIDKLTATAKDLLAGDKGSLKAKAIELNALMADADTTRGKVVDQLKAAISHYGLAVTDSEKIRTEGKKDIPAGSAEDMLQKQRVAVHETSSLRIRQAEASASLAAVEAAHAVILARKVTVMQSAASSATPLALSVPAELLDPKVNDSLKDARSAADASYTAADSTLDGVISSSSASASNQTKTAARVARAVVNVGWSQLAAASGDTESARSHMANAQEAKTAVANEPNGVAIPAYLMMLTETPGKSSSGDKAPADAPATKTEPTTAPAVEPAVAPATAPATDMPAAPAAPATSEPAAPAQ